MQKAQLKMTVIPAFLALQQKGCIVCVRVHTEGCWNGQGGSLVGIRAYTRWDCEQVRSLEELSDGLHIGIKIFSAGKGRYKYRKGEVEMNAMVSDH